MMEDGSKIGNWTSSTEDILTRNFPLHRACRDGDLETLSSLLSTGEHDVYAEDDFYGWTPIHWAAYFGKLTCLMCLMERGINCDVPTERFNTTASHIAAYGGHGHCLKWLLHSGALINRQLACLRVLVNQLAQADNCASCDLTNTRFRQTSAHLCSLGGHPQCLLWVLQSGGSLDAQDYLGETPTHKAARTGSMECISLLVSQGGKLSLRNHSGNTASQVAASSGFPECAKYLENALLIQTQANSVYDEMRTPVTCIPNTGVNLPCVGGDPNKKLARLGTIPYDLNELNTIDGALLPNSDGSVCHNSNHLTNGFIHDNNNQTEDCDMEMGDEMPEGGRGLQCGAHNGDILSHDSISQNLAHLAGKKRGREDVEYCVVKKSRNDDLEIAMDPVSHDKVQHQPNVSMNTTAMECSGALTNSLCTSMLAQPRPTCLSADISDKQAMLDSKPVSIYRHTRCVALKSHFI